MDDMIKDNSPYDAADAAITLNHIGQDGAHLRLTANMEYFGAAPRVRKSRNLTSCVAHRPSM
jgi:hypothetical protein